jgi:hypothetical protein
MYGVPGPDPEALLYVGKASSLRDRVGSYFKPGNLNPKVQALVGQIAIDRGHGHGLRDRGAAARVQPDQGAQAALQRGAARRQELPLHLARHLARISAPVVLSRVAFAESGRYFGPFPSAGAVNETLHHLQKRVPPAQLPRQLFRATAAGPACSTRSAAAPRPACACIEPDSLCPRRRGGRPGAGGARQRGQWPAGGTHGGGGAAAGLRGGRTVARPARGAQGDPGAAGRAGRGRARRRRVRDRGRAGQLCRQRDAGARRPQPRHFRLLPARRARRAGRSAGLVPDAVLRRARGTAGDLRRHLGGRMPRRSPRRCRSSPAATCASSVRSAAWRRAGSIWCARTPRRRCGCASRARMPTTRWPRRLPTISRLGPRGRAGAHGVLRHQPHAGRGHRRLLRGVRPRRAAEEGIPALQHHRRRARATTTARCARPCSGATRASARAKCRAPTCC